MVTAEWLRLCIWCILGLGCYHCLSSITANRKSKVLFNIHGSLCMSACAPVVFLKDEQGQLVSHKQAK